MAKFEESIEIILKHEGGYVNNPDDPGGETNWGISKRSYPDVDIKKLTKDDAKEIYYKDYWNKILGYRINDQRIANQLMDFAVNAGVKRCTKMVQELLKLEKTGNFGDITLSYLNSVNYDMFLLRFKLKRIEYYVKIAKRKSLRQFLYAWVKRTMES